MYWRTDRKAASPKQFFKQITLQKTENQRIAALQDSLSYYGNKGARDTLIELGARYRLYGVGRENLWCSSGGRNNGESRQYLQAD